MALKESPYLTLFKAAFEIKQEYLDGDEMFIFCCPIEEMGNITMYMMDEGLDLTTIVLEAMGDYEEQRFLKVNLRLT